MVLAEAAEGSLLRAGLGLLLHNGYAGKGQKDRRLSLFLPANGATCRQLRLLAFVPLRKRVGQSGESSRRQLESGASYVCTPFRGCADRSRVSNVRRSPVQSVASLKSFQSSLYNFLIGVSSHAKCARTRGRFAVSSNVCFARLPCHARPGRSTQLGETWGQTERTPFCVSRADGQKPVL